MTGAPSPATPSSPAAPGEVRCTAFDGSTRLASGPLFDVALAVKAATGRGAAGPLLIFDDATGRVIDVDLRGTPE